MKGLIALVAAALFVGAFGITALARTAGDGGRENVSPAAGTQSPESTSGPREFATVAQLRDAAIAAGYVCSNWKQQDNVTLAAESGSCSADDVFATFATRADLEKQMAIFRDLEEVFDEHDVHRNPILVGPNWIINSGASPAVADALGGVVSR